MEEKLDAELVRLARTNNKYAFHQLIERYQMMAYCLALRLCSEEETAREIVQEATLQAYLSLDHLQDEARFKSWFYGIVLNVYRNWMRSYGQKQTSSLDALSAFKNYESLFSDSPHDLYLDPQEIIEARELQRLVRESLHTLSLKNRQVAQLFYYEDMSIQQIACRLNITQGAVKNRLHKGREQLRSHLQSVYPELAYSAADKRKEELMIPVTLARVAQQQHRTTLILLDEQQQLALPLWFPPHKNTNPALLLMMSSTGVDKAPDTVNVIVDMLDALGGELTKVEIDALQGHILYALLHLRGPHGQQTLKAHLHDALALAVRLNSAFAVSEEVFNQRGIALKDMGVILDQQLDAMMELASNTSTPIKTSGDLAFTKNLSGWNLHLDREYTDYRLDKQTTYTGKPSLFINLQKSQGFIQLQHDDIQADPYRGQRIHLVAYLKTEDVQQASLCLGVSAPPLDPEEDLPAYYSTVNQQPIEDIQDWQRYELVIDVPDDAYSINPVFNMWRRGKVWLNGIHIEVVDKNTPLTGTQLMMQPYPLNLAFTQGLSFWQLEGEGAHTDYTSGVEQTIQGTLCAFLKAAVEQPQHAQSLHQTVFGKHYLGKRVRLSASIKTADVTQQASLFISTGDHAEDRTIQTLTGTTSWTSYTIEHDVPKQWGLSFSFGITLHGQGQLWLKDVHLEMLDEHKAEQAK